MKTINNQHPSSIRCLGSNSRPLDCEPSALTTRPRLLAFNLDKVFRTLVKMNNNGIAGISYIFINIIAFRNTYINYLNSFFLICEMICEKRYLTLIYLFISVSLCPSVCMSVHLSVPVCLSVFLSHFLNSFSNYRAPSLYLFLPIYLSIFSRISINPFPKQ